MSTKLQALKEEFIQKEDRLETARKQLKNEFFGIDTVIDQLINNTRSWYVLNDYQEKPLIINLWGLTGVGKTSLVQRLAELLSYSDLLFRFDLGDKNSTGFRDNLEELCEKKEDQPIMLILDEFQHARTLEGPHKKEISKDSNRKVWDLIDSGKIEYYSWKASLYRFIKYVTKLESLLYAGVVVEDGKIVEGHSLYTEEIDTEFFEEKEDEKKEKEVTYFVDQEYYSLIISYSREELGFKLQKEVHEHLLNLNGSQIIDFLKQVIKIAKKPEIKNFSKAIIFVIGNLDEAYHMSKNLMADIDADNFYEASLKINMPQIKEALTQRFRSEQIARLGNTHIIYPSLNKKAYQQLIEYKLKEIAQKTRSKLGVDLEFCSSIKQLIYREGVFPTQGMRPVVTTIDYIIQSNLSQLFTIIIQQNLAIEKLIFSYKDEEICVDFYEKEDCKYQKRLPVLTPLEDLRKPKQNDLQAITAVHESGHAILTAILLKTIPEVVYSVTSNSNSLGFVQTKFSWKYIAKNEIINRVAVNLGGIVAEELVFGKDYITTGASSDIFKTTELLTKLYKEQGMGSLPIKYSADKCIGSAYHKNKTVNQEIENALKQGLQLAKQTLTKEKKLLLKLSDYLSDYPRISKEELREFINTHKTTKVEFIENADLLYYRKHLKNKIKQLERPIQEKYNPPAPQVRYHAVAYQKSNDK